MAMEREILLTGIGGQSIQLGAQTLARAAVHEDRHVMLLGTYGGTMRGGSTEASLVVGDAPLSSPPIVSHAWSALAMHHRYWDSVARKLRPGAVVLLGHIGRVADEGVVAVAPIEIVRLAVAGNVVVAASSRKRVPAVELRIGEYRVWDGVRFKAMSVIAERVLPHDR